ncbi:MAG: hypothetical protein QM784_30210 [Polyangiaceae bacterium]
MSVDSNQTAAGSEATSEADLVDDEQEQLLSRAEGEIASDSQRVGRSETLGAKATFVRQQPEDMSAREIVESAAKQGLRISLSQVYRLRVLPTDTSRNRRKRQPNQSRLLARDEFSTTVEKQLWSAIAQLGLLRSYKILESVEAALGVRYR